MLEAFIIDELKREDEQKKWEPLPILVPTVESNADRKEEPEKKEDVIRL